MSARLFDQLQNFRRDGAARRRPSPPDPETSRVKRALFGPVNHEENLKFVKQELDKNLQEQSKKYNFDFSAGRPLEGRYEWEELSEQARSDSEETSEARVPPLSRHQLPTPSNPSEPDRDCDQAAEKEEKAKGSSEARHHAWVDAKTEPPPGTPPQTSSGARSRAPPAGSGPPPPQPSSSSSKSSQRQPSITDHFSQRKRSRSKVKVQERKSPAPDDEDDGSPTERAPQQEASS